MAPADMLQMKDSLAIAGLPHTPLLAFQFLYMMSKAEQGSRIPPHPLLERSMASISK
jgi:hypothetical protein